jgi:hypothetical protein
MYTPVPIWSAMAVVMELNVLVCWCSKFSFWRVGAALLSTIRFKGKGRR